MQQQTMQQQRQEKGLKSSRWLGAGTAVMMATLSLGSCSTTRTAGGQVDDGNDDVLAAHLRRRTSGEQT